MLLYHLTPTYHLPRILSEGLLPRRGPRSRRLGEALLSIYFFTSRADADQALMNWLGDEFEEDTHLALLEVQLPTGLAYRQEAFEVQVFAPIPPEAIRVLDRDYGA